MSSMGKSQTLENKVAVITGGSRGIGQAIALRLAKEGADIAIVYQSTKEEAEKVSNLVDQIGTTDEIDILYNFIDHMETKEHAKEVSEIIDSIGSHSMICQANVSDSNQVIRMRDEVISRFGKIDILVNNAGIVRDKAFLKMTDEMWTDVLSVNLNGTFYCTKAVLAGMLERQYGRIVNISSVIGRIGNRGQANYAASKAGMIALTQTLAREFAGTGITVNAIAPGYIETDMIKTVPKRIMEKILAQIPLGRLGKPSEVAGAVAYLASEDADYITGHVIDMNGGLYIG